MGREPSPLTEVRYGQGSRALAFLVVASPAPWRVPCCSCCQARFLETTLAAWHGGECAGPSLIAV